MRKLSRRVNHFPRSTILNLSNLYELTFTDEGFQFTNNTGDQYYVYLTEHALLYPYGDNRYIDVYMLGFSCKRSDLALVHHYDEKTKDTLLLIFESLVSQYPDDAFIYVCDNQDGKGRNRSITFAKWFNESDRTFERQYSEIRYGEQSLYTAILIKKDNHNRQLFIDAYHYTIKQLLNKS